MKRILVLVEGQTEETFVARTLAPFLVAYDVAVQPTQVATKVERKRRAYRGGHGCNYDLIRRDIVRLLHDSNAVLVTTMLDYYGLPSNFPGMPAAGKDCFERADSLEAAFAADVNDRRFLANLVLHEFETFVFAGPIEAEQTLNRQGLAAQLQQVADQCGSAERINDSQNTCPSRRLARIEPRYKKTLHGPMIVERIGISSLCNACPRFGVWVRKLQEVGSPPGLPSD